ncbi:patatin-like phospholipase family protein [Tessaracoccus flavus]|uniref:Uncharacterized protein n=1 Tax=Tessaracoccus flavus TaxID=1610493 RepID=A0A1Q2CCK7_9ACTN|nr:patatin-like phospholipase family protein [Tessaracoccus flavus]AQP43831.1 hypothetical protein RPIT_02535 [Tessaracoccus flavus]SDY25463.1 Patatin-like phospholipase [Tessaracoccus flavus]
MAVNRRFTIPFLTQDPRDETVACVLSGGGSRASFQLGALDYLYRHDESFSPTVFVGTSAGSIVASVLAQDARRDQQHAYLLRLAELWSGMTTPADMFTPRPWYERLQEEGPGWLTMVNPPRPAPKPRTPLLPFLRQPDQAPDPEARSETAPSPLELALLPDEEVRSEWSLAALSGLAGNVGRLPRIGSDLNTIWQGLERTRSLYRPGPVLGRLLEPETFDPARVRLSGSTLRVAMVALESGELRYMTERGTLVDRQNRPLGNTAHDLTVGVLASCSIPAVFRPVPIGDETYVDGGARENLPAELALNHLGVGRTYVISSQSLGVQRRASMANADLFTVVMRSTEILIDEAGRDELAYAEATGATVVYPELGVHDAMVVHPGLIAINMAYGWFRAAEQHLELDDRAAAQHRRIIDLRIRILDLEQRFLGLESPTSRDLMVLRSAKVELRDAVRGAHTTPLPDGAEQWWTQWERHPEPPTMQPPWMPMPAQG